MKLISLNITNKQVEFIDKLVKLGYYPNKSEAMRSLINDGIKIQLKIIGVLEDE